MMIEALAIAVTLTSYQPIPEQTDGSPTWTSIGDRTSKFGCAVSQDLLRSGRVSYGDVLLIDGFGYRIVNDTMNARIRNGVDLLVFTHAEEKKIGVRHVTVHVLRRPYAIQSVPKSQGHTEPQAKKKFTK